MPKYQVFAIRCGIAPTNNGQTCVHDMLEYLAASGTSYVTYESGASLPSNALKKEPIAAAMHNAAATLLSTPVCLAHLTCLHAY